jgi:hypothetical protein
MIEEKPPSKISRVASIVRTFPTTMATIGAGAMLARRSPVVYEECDSCSLRGLGMSADSSNRLNGTARHSPGGEGPPSSGRPLGFFFLRLAGHHALARLGSDRRQPLPHVRKPLLPLANVPLQPLPSSPARGAVLQLGPVGGDLTRYLGQLQR